MNENEIITALECCSKGNCTNECPFYHETSIVCLHTQEKLNGFALALIKRKNAESEELKRRNQNLTFDLTSAKAEVENLIKIIQHRNSENGKLIIELQAMRGAANSYKAENERLKNSDAVSREYVSICDKEIEDWKNLCNDYKSKLLDVAKRIKHIKSEARKEFWERLKAQNTMDERIISVQSGDNLLAEMESERG